MTLIFLLLGIAVVIVVIVLAVGLTGPSRKKEEFLSASTYTSSLQPHPSAVQNSSSVDSMGPSGVSPEVHARISSLIAEGQPISAIKLLREKTSLSLLDAKHMIDQWEHLPHPESGQPMQYHSTTNAVRFADSDIDRILGLIQAGRKIEAIKEVRLASGLGLKEAKDLVDLWAVQGRLPGQGS